MLPKLPGNSSAWFLNRSESRFGTCLARPSHYTLMQYCQLVLRRPENQYNELLDLLVLESKWIESCSAPALLLLAFRGCIQGPYSGAAF